MAGLKVYFDLMSQPSRTLLLLLRAAQVPHVPCPVALRRLEHLSDEYAQVHPFKKVPAINDNGFKLFESVAILRYLCREKPEIAEHWYPRDSRQQARVDEYMEWHHLNTRSYLSLFFLNKIIIPMTTQRPPREETIKKRILEMENTLNQLQDYWLKDRPFLIGDKITIADLLGVCEVEQPGMAGYNAFEKFPIIGAWRERVRKETNPHYDEVHAFAYKFAKQYNASEQKKANL